MHQRSTIRGLWSVVCGSAMAVILAGAAWAATPDAPERWQSGGVGGWTRQDPLNACEQPLNNPADYLEVVFDEQAQSFPEVHIVRADIDASNGDFVGDYWITAITNVSFKLYCESHVPDDLRLYLYNSTSKNWWSYPLSTPKVGEWTEYNVPLDFSRGWRFGSGGTAGEFKNDRKNVAWIGVQILRNGSVEEQVYRIDDFILRGASRFKDADGDGANDWHEFIAGTDSANPNSRFDVDISATKKKEKAPGIIMLHWESAPDTSYSIERTTNLMTEFLQIESGIPGTPPVNEYEDGTATNSVPYFYRIAVE